MRVLPHQISLRPATPDDRALLAAIYASTREEELAQAADWTDEMKAQFLEHQFNAQHTYYQQVYPDAEYLIILVEGQAAGRIYIERNLIPGTIRVIDITLLPPFRNQGIGQYLFRQLMSEAEAAGKTLTIHVEQFNPARHLYERLGFKIIKETHGVYLLMEWTPG